MISHYLPYKKEMKDFFSINNIQKLKREKKILEQNNKNNSKKILLNINLIEHLNYDLLLLLQYSKHQWHYMQDFYMFIVVM